MGALQVQPRVVAQPAGGHPWLSAAMGAGSQRRTGLVSFNLALPAKAWGPFGSGGHCFAWSNWGPVAV